jgi:hypothetical protein
MATVPAFVLFAFGLLLRLLFWHGGPDGGAGWHVACQGDAPVWQDLAHKLANGIDDDQLRLPWRPPGMLWLVSAIWNGAPATAWLPRLGMCVLGAAFAPLFWLWLRTKVAAPVALLASAITAAATNLLVLSSGLHNETIYLLLVIGALFAQDRLEGTRAPLFAIAFGLLHGAACLVRAEHALTVLALALIAHSTFRRWTISLSATAALAALLVPWQLHADAQVDAYNAGAPALPPSALPWQPDAIAAVRALPSFQQVPIYRLVTDSARVRGNREVAASDLEIVREAFGVWPEALPHAFIAIYGGLNFFLANTPEANGGFAAKALDRPPPLTGGDSRYPPNFRAMLPQNGQVAFSYPPHLDRIVNGMDHGLRELTANPVAAAQRIARKAWHGLEGATGGIGGYALPIGLSGVRRQVDIVTATSTWAHVWRVAVLAVASVGLWRLRHRQALWPLFGFAMTKLAIVLAYFGYARQGALCLPVMALCLAAASERFATWLSGRRLLAIGALLLALEALRAGTTAATIDDQPVTAGEPFGAMRYDDRRLRFH